MKKTTLVFLLLAAPVFLFAQESSTNFPYWTISKSVHSYEYSKTLYKPVTFEIVDVNTLISKNIHRKKRSTTAKAALSGYPTWTISKPVARQAAERKSKKPARQD